MTEETLGTSAMRGAVSARVDAAWRSMENARAALEAMVAGLGSDVAHGTVATQIAALNKSLAIALQEEGKADDARRIERGGDGIDLNAARIEIGRRLDRIRESGGAGGVPERPG